MRPSLALLLLLTLPTLTHAQELTPAQEVRRRAQEVREQWLSSALFYLDNEIFVAAEQGSTYCYVRWPQLAPHWRKLLTVELRKQGYAAQFYTRPGWPVVLRISWNDKKNKQP